VLLDIVDEVSERYGLDGGRFLLQGFSGGGQFAHRFFYLHPDRLAGVSIGAPGRITRLDDDQPWWLGTGGFAERFGTPIDHDALRRVPVQMVVGAEDVETWEINNPGDSNWMDGAEKAGRTRIERLETLRADFERHGIAVRFDVVPGVAHNGMGVLAPVREFFASLL
jgi:pimeloyl-ACP methyl ester carboxylesterase